MKPKYEKPDYKDLGKRYPMRLAFAYLEVLLIRWL